MKIHPTLGNVHESQAKRWPFRVSTSHLYLHNANHSLLAVQEKTEKARRQEAALRKAVRAQRNAPDTEEEGDNESPMPSDEDPGDEESEEGEEEEPHSVRFSFNTEPQY